MQFWSIIVFSWIGNKCGRVVAGHVSLANKVGLLKEVPQDVKEAISDAFSDEEAIREQRKVDKRVGTVGTVASIGASAAAWPLAIPVGVAKAYTSLTTGFARGLTEGAYVAKHGKEFEDDERTILDKVEDTAHGIVGTASVANTVENCAGAITEAADKIRR